LVTTENVNSRSMSRDPQRNRSPEEQFNASEEARVQAAAGGGTGEAGGPQVVSGELEGREEHLQSMVQSALQRIQSRLGRPSKLSPEDVSKRSEERQRRAQQVRAEQEEHRLQQLRQLGNRVSEARDRRTLVFEREQEKQVELLDKMSRARRQYQDQLRTICERARNENRKSAEVAYVTKEGLKSEKEIMRQKQENARLQRALLREQMRKKLIQSANRVAKVSENKRRQQESWQKRVSQELEEKDRLATQRRKQHIQSVRLKSQEQESHSETVREKRREIQEEDERTVQQQQQDFAMFRSKNIGRLALNVEGLPDGVREEVSEQLGGAVASPSTASGRRSRAARGKALPLGRCSTPPRRHGATMSESLKSSPKSDVPDLDEDIDEDAPAQVPRQGKSRKARAKASAFLPISSHSSG